MNCHLSGPYQYLLPFYKSPSHPALSHVTTPAPIPDRKLLQSISAEHAHGNRRPEDLDGAGWPAGMVSVTLTGFAGTKAHGARRDTSEVSSSSLGVTSKGEQMPRASTHHQLPPNTYLTLPHTRGQ